MTKEQGKEEKDPQNEEKIEVPKKFEKIVGEIEKMSVLDLSELVKVLEKRFGVSAVAPMMAAPAGVVPSGNAEAEEEKSSFNIELKSTGDKKIEVIKAVKELTGKGLKEAKDIVDAAASSPQIIAEGVGKEDAEEIKKKFEAAGAGIELK